MQLVWFSHDGGAPQPGLVTGDTVVPLSALFPDAPTDMRALIAAWDTVSASLGDPAASDVKLPLDAVTLLAPVPNPEKILALGMNYSDHMEEARQQGVKIPDAQVWFTKLPSSVSDPFGDVHKPLASDKLDYEVELVVVIGKGGKNISKEDAPDAVFGYAVGQDFSARDWQFKSPQWVLGKSFDTHAPVGPGIVTADQIGDPHRLDLKCWVNGELRQSSNTKLLHYNVWDQIEELSQAITLKPGDLILTGTPAGVGVAMDPPVFLKEGDLVRTEIEELGVIENKIVNEV